MTKTLPISEVRTKLPEIVDKTSKLMDQYVITVNGKPAAMLISLQEYDSMQETLDVLSDKKLMKVIKESEEDIKYGRVQDWEEVKKELGWDV